MKNVLDNSVLMKSCQHALEKDSFQAMQTGHQEPSEDQECLDQDQACYGTAAGTEMGTVLLDGYWTAWTGLKMLMLRPEVREGRASSHNCENLLLRCLFCSFISREFQDFMIL